MKQLLCLTGRDVTVLYTLFVRFEKKTVIQSGWVTDEAVFKVLMAVAIELIQCCESLFETKLSAEPSMAPGTIDLHSCDNLNLNQLILLDSQTIEHIKSLLNKAQCVTYINLHCSLSCASDVIHHIPELLLKIEASIINNEINGQ